MNFSTPSILDQNPFFGPILPSTKPLQKDSLPFTKDIVYDPVIGKFVIYIIILLIVFKVKNFIRIFRSTNFRSTNSMGTHCYCTHCIARPGRQRYRSRLTQLYLGSWKFDKAGIEEFWTLGKHKLVNRAQKVKIRHLLVKQENNDKMRTTPL